MNKSDLIDVVHKNGDYQTKAAAAAAVDDVLEGISEGITNGGKVQLVGFGTFKVKERAARTGRNPRTGASIKIGPSRNVGFKAGKALKEQL
ncbi:MAG: HU family DNA-binding protein [Myxococcota bacterium]